MSDETLQTRQPDLLRRTLRMVLVLVGACVIFVGALSVVAVLVTTKAVSGSRSVEATTSSEPSPKKPLSI